VIALCLSYQIEQSPLGEFDVFEPAAQYEVSAHRGIL
jgi:hypothetical protein